MSLRSRPLTLHWPSLALLWLRSASSLSLAGLRVNAVQHHPLVVHMSHFRPRLRCHLADVLSAWRAVYREWPCSGVPIRLLLVTVVSPLCYCGSTVPTPEANQPLSFHDVIHFVKLVSADVSCVSLSLTLPPAHRPFRVPVCVSFATLRRRCLLRPLILRFAKRARPAWLRLRL